MSAARGTHNEYVLKINRTIVNRELNRIINIRKDLVAQAGISSPVRPAEIGMDVVPIIVLCLSPRLYD